MPDMDRAVAALKAAKSIVFLLVLVFQRRVEYLRFVTS